MRALIADDDLQFSDALAVALTKNGAHVETARSLDDAVSESEIERIDVIVIGFCLPGVSVLDYIAELIARRRVPKLIVMVKTHRVSGALCAMAAKSLGVQEVFFKPFDVSELVASVTEQRSRVQGTL